MGQAIKLLPHIHTRSLRDSFLRSAAKIMYLAQRIMYNPRSQRRVLLDNAKLRQLPENVPSPASWVHHPDALPGRCVGRRVIAQVFEKSHYKFLRVFYLLCI